MIKSDNNTTLIMQFSTDAGMNWQATNYDYGVTYNYAASILSNVQNGTAQSSISMGIALGNGAANSINGSVTLYGLGSAAVNKKATFKVAAAQQGTATFINSTGQGGWGTTTVVNGIRLMMLAGTITSGTFRLFGVM